MVRFELGGIRWKISSNYILLQRGVHKPARVLRRQIRPMLPGVWNQQRNHSVPSQMLKALLPRPGSIMQIIQQ